MLDVALSWSKISFHDVRPSVRLLLECQEIDIDPNLGGSVALRSQAKGQGKQAWASADAMRCDAERGRGPHLNGCLLKQFLVIGGVSE